MKLDENLTGEARLDDSMASTLTLGLLHQLNNVLTGIYFNVEELAELIKEGDPGKQAIGEIWEVLQEVHRLVEKTVDVNLAPEVDDLAYHDIEDLVSSQFELVRLLFPKTVAVTVCNPTRPQHVHASAPVFRFLLLNLATTVRSALPHFNTEISIEISVHDQAFVAVRLGCEDDTFCLVPDAKVIEVLRHEAERHGWHLTDDLSLLLPRVEFAT